MVPQPASGKSSNWKTVIATARSAGTQTEYVELSLFLLPLLLTPLLCLEEMRKQRGWQGNQGLLNPENL